MLPGPLSPDDTSGSEKARKAAHKVAKPAAAVPIPVVRPLASVGKRGAGSSGTLHADSSSTLGSALKKQRQFYYEQESTEEEIPADLQTTHANTTGKEMPVDLQTAEVEVLLDVRVTSTGESEFLIRWTGDEENTWEPEVQIQDDSLLDEFMKPKIARMAPSDGKYSVGAVVEVLDKNFKYSWASAKVLSVGKDGTHTVKYKDFFNGESHLVEKGIERGRLRPLQPTTAPSRWRPTLGELIEVFDDAHKIWREGKMLGPAGPAGPGSENSKFILVQLRVNDISGAYPWATRARPAGGAPCGCGRQGL